MYVKISNNDGSVSEASFEEIITTSINTVFYKQGSDKSLARQGSIEDVLKNGIGLVTPLYTYKNVNLDDYYTYFVGHITTDKISNNLLGKVYNGEDFTMEDNLKMIEIIERERARDR